jgi:hypothetical protein
MLLGITMVVCWRYLPSFFKFDSFHMVLLFDANQAAARAKSIAVRPLEVF